ncbi:hypothetical protein M9434_007189 [Picochlorum sp. BPE23]|nr:hypothetical protein M9434_007189 [Picochlorum sp. BPE23]
MNETTGKIPKRKYLSNGSRKPADIYSVKGLAEHGQSDWDVPSTNLNVYIYDDPVFFPDLCRNQSSGKYPRSYYFDVMDLWLEQLHSHPSRVKIPQKASKIFVPFNVDDSFAAGTCKGSTSGTVLGYSIHQCLRSLAI